ncbi:CLUMA_CG005381, isoform A [Clunio marinus]|uniref:CLUMA_CG005381, isoform A n=1 Tax=Clunio marinus TaxID=568069 RepID=A0A1J1HUS0_9DIPT|nr:CLUMA_CG005381, isoform A [Clunio marinus]
MAKKYLANEQIMIKKQFMFEVLMTLAVRKKKGENKPKYKERNCGKVMRLRIFNDVSIKIIKRNDLEQDEQEKKIIRVCFQSSG